MDLTHLKDQIIAHPYFQKLKEVIENIEGYHENESTFDHLLKTARIAEEILDGHFITNTEAKERFLVLVHQEIHETTLKTILVLTALLHDCGKLLLYTENNTQHTLKLEKPNNQTIFPGHPFWGGQLVVPEILKDSTLSTAAKQMIADIVKVHNAYEEPYFLKKTNWSLVEIISDIKAGATGYYKEALFNIYCDCYTAPAFASARKQIEKIFNDPSFYDKRRYILP